MKANLTKTAIAIAIAIGLAPTVAYADFADAEIGARGLSLGGAFVAVDGDPASMFWNPAAILSERRIQVTGMRTRLFDGLEDVNEDFVGITASLHDDIAVGFGWTRTGLKDVYYEDVFNGTIAYRLPGKKLSLGVSVLVFGADAPGYEPLNDPNYLGRQWEPSFSVGALFKWSEVLQFGVSFENLLKPEMSLLGNSTDVDAIGGRRRFGAVYVVQEVVRLSTEVRHNDFPDYYDSDWTLHAGAESWFNGVLALRVGIDDGDLAVGAGLLVDRVRFDGGLVSNERLGNTFRAAITIGY